MTVLNIDIASVEGHRLIVQNTIYQKKTLRERNQLGQFATPLPLAIDIARAVRGLTSDATAAISFGEPALGTGSFFSALLHVFPREAIRSAVGIEFDNEFANASFQLWGQHGLQVITGDFTERAIRDTAQHRPTLILTNPPYVRHHHLKAEQKEKLQRLATQVTGINVNGLSGFYVYFMLIAHDWLENEGLAAWLIPSEFMDVNYGLALKQYLTECVTLIGIHRFDPADVQFDDALVSSAVVIFRKVTPASNARARMTFGGTVTEPAHVQEVPISELRRARKWTAYPKFSSYSVPQEPTLTELTLGDLFRIQRGIATGANEFFILDREEARSIGIPDQYLRPILPSPRYLSETVIQQDEDGFPKLSPQLIVIDCNLPEEELAQKHPKLWQYIRTAENQGIRDRYLMRQREPWYKQERRAPAPFLCTYMGRGVDEAHPFRFILNYSDAIAPNVYLMMYPQEPLETLLREDPRRYEDVFHLLKRITANDLKGEGRVYGGGLHKIEPKELGRVSAHSFLDRFPQLAGMHTIQLSLLLEKHPDKHYRTQRHKQNI